MNRVGYMFAKCLFSDFRIRRRALNGVRAIRHDGILLQNENDLLWCLSMVLE